MAEEIVEVTVAPDGTVRMQVRGIAGMACLDETEDLVGWLGGVVRERELHGEAYLDVESQERHDRLQQ